MAPLNRFNRVAQFYDRLATLVFGKSIWRAHTECLNRVPDGSNVLVLGGGSGWWLPAFLKSHPNVRLCYIEASSNMLSQAKGYVGDEPRIEFIHATDERLSEIQGTFDAVITCFFFDVFSDTQLPKIIKTISQKLKYGGRWCVADFVSDRWWHRWMLKVMYLFFKGVGALDATRLPAWQRLLDELNMKLMWDRYYYGGFIRSLVVEK